MMGSKEILGLDMCKICFTCTRLTTRGGVRQGSCHYRAGKVGGTVNQNQPRAPNQSALISNVFKC